MKYKYQRSETTKNCFDFDYLGRGAHAALCRTIYFRADGANNVIFRSVFDTVLMFVVLLV